MENIFKLDENGQQVIKDDFEAIGETAGLADDRVFAEILRLAPYSGTVSRGILPFGHTTSGDLATVEPNGATGKVLVRPFRAVIGSRTASGTDSLKNWRDVRSAIHYGSSSTVVGTELSLTANMSADARWDLVYAAVSVDSNSSPSIRKVKDPVTKVITDESVSLFLQTVVSVGVSVGTTSPTPTMAAGPADGAGTYYIPLAWVRVPAGFTSTSTVLPSDIAESSHVVSLSRTAGVSSLRPSSRAATATTAQQQTWGSTGTRPTLWMPSSMRGAETLVIPVDTSVDSDGAILDDSVDWRHRLCRFTIALAPSGTSPVWAGGAAFSPYSYLTTLTASSNYTVSGVGHTCAADVAGKAFAALVAGEDIAVLPNGTKIGVYCDLSTGALKLHIDGAVGSLLALVWLELTAPFTNRS